VGSIPTGDVYRLAFILMAVASMLTIVFWSGKR
jgi:hypothetical protein